MARIFTLKSEIFAVHRYAYDAAPLPRFAFRKSSLDFQGTIVGRSSPRGIYSAEGTVTEREPRSIWTCGNSPFGSESRDDDHRRRRRRGSCEGAYLEKKHGVRRSLCTLNRKRLTCARNSQSSTKRRQKQIHLSSSARRSTGNLGFDIAQTAVTSMPYRSTARDFVEGSREMLVGLGHARRSFHCSPPTSPRTNPSIAGK